MDTLDKKLNFEFRTSQQILKLISEIDLFKGKWEILENQNLNILKELKNIATIQSIGSSTRIEGATLSDDEVKQLISDLKIYRLENRDEQEVVGYYDGELKVLQRANNMEATHIVWLYNYPIGSAASAYRCAE